jgi:1-phosphatidylinositol phosphodiesterase
VTLSQLSLPGTHESLSQVGGDLVRCQTMSLQSQLAAGIRVIDIRLGPGAMYSNLLKAYHGPIDQGVTFDEVLSTLNQFLTSNPNETVLMRVDNESPSPSSVYDNNLPALSSADFKTAFASYWSAYSYLFYNPSSKLNSSYADNPPLSAMRGTVVVLDNFSSTYYTGGTTAFGLKYNAPNFSIQDDYQISSNWALYTKWTQVFSQLIAANTQATIGNPANIIFVNYLSGATGSASGDLAVLPYFVASGKSSPGTNAPQLLTGAIVSPSSSYDQGFPRSCDDAGKLTLCSVSFDGTNDMTVNWMSTTNLKGTGIVMADFPGASLIWGVFMQNAPTILLP